MRLWIITSQFQLKKQDKQKTNTQLNLLIITVSCVKKICLVRSKKKNYRKLKNRTINKSEHVAK